ncbi:hypothetical protein DFR70_108239 [Nocardia tenerifensis]|uniref:Uncharacterized protein n=1 Tax=Nocardia tenerifensis TaxID=228006 RepID=A0A318K122_9NOCA|nr:DUF6188 family protein [Nocardia tenerifensis]PXX61681.1 hypothetical protein DFR70_108239 [Nocardia tenerifensis]
MELRLDIVGQRVSEVIVGFTVTVRMGSPTAFELQIEGEVDFRTSGGDLSQAGSNDYGDIGSELESLVGSTVTRADASEVDGLSLQFDSGAQIHVPIHEMYEAWGLVGLDGYRVICLPGGEFAIWSARKEK